jgi:hypothetical protein
MRSESAGGDLSDVSAVVLSQGEPTTRAALESVRGQTLPPREVIVIENMAPFHRALNAGAARVETRFFVQVDADMVLDPGCLAELRRRVRWDTGIVVGQLRDPLIGRVVGIKLFRTRCFRIAPFPDSISPDTDFGGAIARAGWDTVYIGAPLREGGDDWTTYGEHRPDYSFAYTYRKYQLEGRRYRYRGKPSGIRWHFARLEQSQHPAALVAQIGLARGIFLDQARDLLGPLEVDDEFLRLERFLERRDDPAGGPVSPGGGALRLEDLLGPLPEPPAQTFRRFRRWGRNLAAERGPGDLARVMLALGPTRRNQAAWIAKVGLCSGLALPADEDRATEADWNVLDHFIGAERDEPRSTGGRWEKTVSRRARLLLGFLTGGSR